MAARTLVGVSIVPFLTVPLTLLAIPLVYFGRRRLSLARCGVYAAGFGLLGAAAILAGASPLTAPHWFLYTTGLALMTVGLVSGVLFWAIGIWRNDNLTNRWSGP
jgi:hypothetical protein